MTAVGGGAELSQPADQVDRQLSARRLDRRGGARHAAAAWKSGWASRWSIENRGGAGGNIGVDAVAKSAPDGYTIGFAAAGALSVNVSLMEKMPYNVRKDLIPITLVGTSPFILIASTKFDAALADAVIAAAKAKPGELSIGYGGNGTAMHLTAALFNQMGGISTTLVPYRGSGPVTADVVAGHIPLGITDGPSAMGQIKGGAVKPHRGHRHRSGRRACRMCRPSTNSA